MIFLIVVKPRKHARMATLKVLDKKAAHAVLL